MEGGAALLFQNSKLRTLKHVTIARPVKSATGPAIVMSGGTLNLWNSMIVSHTQGISMTGGTLNHDYNLYFGNDIDVFGTVSATLNTGTQIVHGDPRFVAPAVTNYHLRPGSPAANAGADLGVRVDLDGQTRPSAGGYDIGADELWILNYLPFLRR